MFRNDIKITATIAFTAAGLPHIAAAQDAAATPVEEVIVTGSFIRRPSQFDAPSPLITIGRDEMGASGAAEIGDIIEDLTINSGSQNNPDAFTQNFSTGTSNINLRGLGVSSSLVLINGRRQTQSAVATDRGENFVDTSSLPPMIAFDRIEILKDGATALYGSEAVAGVVNFMTRSDFRGFEIELDLQTVDGYPQDDLRLSALYGGGNDTTHVLAALSILDRDPLTTNDRRLSGPLDDLSQAGNPGSFLVTSIPGNPLYAPIWSAAFDSNGNGVADAVEPQIGLPPVLDAALPVFADPACAAIATQDPKVVPSFAATVPTPAGDVPIGLCQFDFGGYYSIVPEEQRASAFVEVDHIFSDTLTGAVELHIANNDAQRNNSPSFPFSSFPVVPAVHPDNPFGSAVSFIGRVEGAGGAAVPSFHDSDTWRLAGRLEGDLSDRWRFDAAVTLSENEFEVRTEDTLIDRFSLAMQGLGGPACDPATGVAGVAPCGWFNPFGSALTGTGTINSDALLDDITGNFSYRASSELMTLDGLIAGRLGTINGSPVELAAGVQFRDEQLTYDYDANTNNDNFLFFAGIPDFSNDRDVTAVFVEFNLPLSDTLDLQLAARHEDYGTGFSSTDPKLAFLWRPADQISVRGSVGTAFRAPSLFQDFGIQTSLVQLTDPTVGIPQFFPVRTQADQNVQGLDPEEADVLNLGISFSPIGDLEISLDYWSFDYNQVIIQQNPQAVLNAAAAGNPTALNQVNRDPLSGLLLGIDTFYANASSLETDGFDLSIAHEFDLGSGALLRVGADATIVTSYDLVDPQAGPRDGLGWRNFANFATSMPEVRATVFAGWSTDRQGFDLFLRHIDGYRDDERPTIGSVPVPIGSFTTLDAQYRYQFRGDRGPALALGAVNLLDEDPPYVRTNGGYDAKVHDPRGRVLYARASINF